MCIRDRAETPTVRMYCHPSWLIGAPTSAIPTILRRMAFLTQPSLFILAWDRHRICWLAYPVYKCRLTVLLQSEYSPSEFRFFLVYMVVIFVSGAQASSGHRQTRQLTGSTPASSGEVDFPSMLRRSDSPPVSKFIMFHLLLNFLSWTIIQIWLGTWEYNVWG